ncbi:MAG TPA: hypothetical protein VN066_11125 [Rhodocyclaceae bacterium]|nr:hypothetical protein [Rhodocyclaceae bacterium]
MEIQHEKTVSEAARFIAVEADFTMRWQRLIACLCRGWPKMRAADAAPQCRTSTTAATAFYLRKIFFGVKRSGHLHRVDGATVCRS